MDKLFKKALAQFDEVNDYVRTYRGTIRELAYIIGTTGTVRDEHFTAEYKNILCEIKRDENRQIKVLKGKYDTISVVDGDDLIGEYTYEELKKRALSFDELTAQQLWELRCEIELGSCYIASYNNSFGFNSKDMCYFFEGYLQDLEEIAKTRGKDPEDINGLDNIDNLVGWYQSCEDYSWVKKEA